MKLLYISSINPKLKTGYYNAVVDRVEALTALNEVDIELLNYSRSPGPSAIKYIKKPIFLFQKWPMRIVENVYIENKIAAHLKDNLPDLVHVHWCYPIGYCTIKICKALNIPCVLTCHGSDIHTNPFKAKFIARKTKWALENASKVIFVSEQLESQAQEIFGEKFDSITIPNALDQNLINLSGNKEAKSRQKIISYVGNLNSTKGVDLLPAIFTAISEKCKNPKFIIAGSGPLRKHLEAAFKINGTPVEFLGHIAREEALTLIRKSDLLVIPSRSEGFGIVALEAFCLKTPCVAFDIPGLREVFRGNDQFLAQQNSIDDFAIKSLAVLTQSKTPNFDRYIHDYDISYTIQKEMEQYISILAKQTRNVRLSER